MKRWNWHTSIPKQLVRRDIHIRDDFTCQICKCKPNKPPINYDGSHAVSFSNKWLEVDHIIAINNGGTNGKENLQTLCNSCNCKKGVK